MATLRLPAWFFLGVALSVATPTFLAPRGAGVHSPERLVGDKEFDVPLV
jgi:hypothetical protein